MFTVSFEKNAGPIGNAINAFSKLEKVPEAHRLSHRSEVAKKLISGRNIARAQNSASSPVVAKTSFGGKSGVGTELKSQNVMTTKESVPRAGFPSKYNYERIETRKKLPIEPTDKNNKPRSPSTPSRRVYGAVGAGMLRAKSITKE